jgi:hypothetical protein
MIRWGSFGRDLLVIILDSSFRHSSQKHTSGSGGGCVHSPSAGFGFDAVLLFGLAALFYARLKVTRG